VHGFIEIKDTPYTSDGPMLLGLALPWDPRDVPSNPKALHSPPTSCEGVGLMGPGVGCRGSSSVFRFLDFWFQVEGEGFKVWC